MGIVIDLGGFRGIRFQGEVYGFRSNFLGSLVREFQFTLCWNASAWIIKGVFWSEESTEIGFRHIGK